MALAMARLRSTSYLLPSSSASRFFSHPRRRCPLPSLASAAAAAAALPFLILKRRTYPTSSTPPICSSSYSPPSSSTEAAEAASASTAFHLHNTLTKRKEPFRPRVEGKVGMYVCGVTAYDLSHIGHARVYVFFDVLYRYLKHLKYDVVYVRNFTDVDDKSICRRALSEELISIGKWKIFLRQLSLYTCPSRDWANNPTLYQIIARANELRENPLTLSSRYCNEFHYDMAHLHCLPPTVEPRVSTHMNQIIDMINQILVNGFAYNVDGDVYFSVDKSPSYGRLSGRRLEDNQPGQRVAVDSRKKNPADFALWKSSKDGELFWESPWGPGRPGWHIECSAMSAAYLGYSFDIHGGGVDLVFPHHENEIAQSCAACRESNVGYWVHNGFVDIGSEKMSKSLGNFVTIRKVIDVYHPLSLRLFLIGKHYRSTVNYSIAQLETASDRLYYIYQTICDCDNSLSEHNKEYLKDSVPNDTKDCTNKFREDFENSLADDLNTPIALASFSEPLKIINDLLHTRKGKKQPMRTESLLILSTKIKDRLDILGLKPSNFSEALFQLREKALRRAGMTEEQVLQKVEERSSARKAKLYEESDEIRKKLAAVGIALMDGPDETSWRPAVPLHVQDQLANAALKNEGISCL